MHIQNFVALDGDWTARVEVDGGETQDVAVAGLGLVKQEWVVCAITDEGKLARVSEWGRVIDVSADGFDPDDDENEGDE